MKKKKAVLLSCLTVLLSVALYLIVSILYYWRDVRFMYERESATICELFDKGIILRFEEGDIPIPYTLLIDYEITEYLPNWWYAISAEYHFDIDLNWKEEAMHQLFQEVYQDVTDAFLGYDEDSGWYVSPADNTRSFDLDELINYIKTLEPDGVITVDMSKFMLQPNVTTEEVTEKFEKVSWLNNFLVDYGGRFQITGKDLKEYLNEDLEIDFELLDLSGIQEAMSYYYNTVGSVKNFFTYAGTQISVKYETYGTTLNWEAEKERLLQCIENKKSCLIKEPYLEGYDNLNRTYIEVSLNDQHLWHFVDGFLCCETDIVTGTLNKRDTPTGVYYISEMIPGKNLKGADYVTWVNRWMRLTNDGVGLHDAYWRSSFGKKIYTYDGSHGCINLPKQFAYDLYKEVERGYPVVIY